MGPIKNLKERADRFEDTLNEHGSNIAEAVQVNSAVLLLVGGVSLVALALAVIAINRSKA